jgi:hypothetical protein
LIEIERKWIEFEEDMKRTGRLNSIECAELEEDKSEVLSYRNNKVNTSSSKGEEGNQINTIKEVESEIEIEKMVDGKVVGR